MCVRDVVGYPLVPVDIQFRGKKHSIKVAVNPHLRHPLILGTDWPAFSQLLEFLCGCLLGDRTREGIGGGSGKRCCSGTCSV